MSHLAPSPMIGARKTIWDRPLYVLTLAGLAAVVLWGAQRGGYEWNWGRIPGFIFDAGRGRPGPLLKGLGVTVEVTLCAFVITSLLGVATAVGRLAGGPVTRGLALAYIELIRNSPLFVLIFVVYFVLGPVLDLPRFWAAVLALSIFEGAYLSEIIRSGILAVDEGQWQASWCLGLSTGQTFHRVIMPQTWPMLLPPMCGLAISLVKDSALVSGIALYDLAMQTRSLYSETWLAFELWLTAGAIYLIINLALSWYGGRLERRLASWTGRTRPS